MSPRSLLEKPRVAETLLYFVALLARLAFAVTGDVPRQDAGHYTLLAHEMLAGLGFRATMREPGMPTFLAAIYYVVGEENLRTAYIVQAFVAALAPVFAYRLYRVALPTWPRTQLGGALLFAVFPVYAAYAAMFYKEAVMLVLITWTAYRMLLALRDPGWRNFLVAGLACGVWWLTREDVQTFFVLFLAYALLRSWRERWSAPQRWSIAASLCALLVVLPWQLRNYFTHGFFGTTRLSNLHLLASSLYLGVEGERALELRSILDRIVRHYHYDIVNETAYQRGMPGKRLLDLRYPERPEPGPRDEEGERLAAELQRYSPERLSQGIAEIFRENVSKHPRRWLADRLQQFRSVFGGYTWYWAYPAWEAGPRWGDSLRTGRWGWFLVKTANGGLFPVVLWVLLIASLWYRPFAPDWFDSLFLLAAVLLFCGVLSLSFPENRHREVYDPLLFVAAARGCAAIALGVRSRWKRSGGAEAIAPAD